MQHCRQTPRGTAWLCVVVVAASRACLAWGSWSGRHGSKPSFACGSHAQAVRPRSRAGKDGCLPRPRTGPAHRSAAAGLGTGRVGSTCAEEDSSWLQVFSKAADFNSIFCCLGPKPSPRSSRDSHPAGVAPRRPGQCFLSLCSVRPTASPVTSYCLEHVKRVVSSADYDDSKC